MYIVWSTIASLTVSGGGAKVTLSISLLPALSSLHTIVFSYYSILSINYTCLYEKFPQKPGLQFSSLHHKHFITYRLAQFQKSSFYEEFVLVTTFLAWFHETNVLLFKWL